MGLFHHFGFRELTSKIEAQVPTEVLVTSSEFHWSLVAVWGGVSGSGKYEPQTSSPRKGVTCAVLSLFQVLVNFEWEVRGPVRANFYIRKCPC